MNKWGITAILTMWTCVEPAFAQWNLVWSDEFNYTGLPDSTKWGYDVGGDGWGNQELQYYTRGRLENSRVENGELHLTAIKETRQQNNYTSTRLISKNNGDWLYGRFEIAAKLPRGRGLWPAIWMLPTDWAYGGWPKSGELDIMENVGFDSMMVHFNIHTEAYNHSIGTNKGNSVQLDNPHTVFNVYVLEWYRDSVVFFVNDLKTFSFKNEHTGSATWPFDKRFHLLLNIAVGGSWGGQQGVDDAIFPREMVIDYVRVYEYAPSSVVPSLVTTRRKTIDITSAGNFLNVTGTSGQAGSLRIFTVDGRLTADLSNRAGTIAVNRVPLHLPAGTYIAALTMNATCTTRLFMVMP